MGFRVHGSALEVNESQLMELASVAWGWNGAESNGNLKNVN